MEPTLAKKPLLLALALLLGLMVFSFRKMVPHMRMDTVQETWYLGIPYKLLQEGKPNVTANDPFLENGPQAVYPPAYIVHKTQSMWLARAYQFLFSLALVFVLFFFFLKQFASSHFSAHEVFAYALLFLGTWVSIPMVLIYPLQTNGMTGGLICAVLGAWFYRQRPLWGMFFFGLAFSFKGQFLAFFPGLAFYALCIDIRDTRWTRHLSQAGARLLMFFVPKSIVLAALWSLLGLFPDMRQLWLYAIDGPELLRYEIQSLVGKLLGSAGGMGSAASIREGEFAGYGLITWGHILLSFVFCAGFAIRALVERCRRGLRQPLEGDRGLYALAWGAFPYWINFLFFYRYPYWYNTFAIVPFNLFLAAAFVRFLQLRLVSWKGEKVAQVFLIVLALAASVFWVRNVRGAAHLGTGNLLSFDWRRS